MAAGSRVSTGTMLMPRARFHEACGADARARPGTRPVPAAGLLRRAEMLGELEALGLVVGADALAVELGRALQHLLVDQPADGLAVLEDERHLARAHLEHGARATAARPRIAEAGIEEARIVDAELAHQRI